MSELDLGLGLARARARGVGLGLGIVIGIGLWLGLYQEGPMFIVLYRHETIEPNIDQSEQKEI